MVRQRLSSLGGKSERIRLITWSPDSAVSIPHHALKDFSINLARIIEWQLGDEVGPPRTSVGGTVGETELLQLLFGDVGAFRLYHQRHWRFTLDDIGIAHNPSLASDLATDPARRCRFEREPEPDARGNLSAGHLPAGDN